MSFALLEQIVNAEAEAEEIRREAALGARKKIEEAEAEAAAIRRRAVLHNAELAKRLLDEARLSTEDEIKAHEVRKSAEYASLRERALSKVDEAARMIYEKVRADGRR